MGEKNKGFKVKLFHGKNIFHILSFRYCYYQFLRFDKYYDDDLKVCGHKWFFIETDVCNEKMALIINSPKIILIIKLGVCIFYKIYIGG